MYIRLRVVAGAKKELFEEISKDHFRVAVKEKAERNMANKRVIELVANYFGIKLYQVKIISGHHSPSKIISLDIPDVS